jgi:nucleotidyltransferase substrate binding protein (TIGR01987 family)
VALDLTSLEKAVASLRDAVTVVRSSESGERFSEPVVVTLKAGLIQNFEFTYELSWKMIQRWIRINLSPEDAEPRTKKDLFRIAAGRGLIADPLRWFEYAEARNLTTHTYDRAKAEQVVEAAMRFLADAETLLAELSCRND